MNYFILSQICGIIALVFAVFSYFSKNKIKFLVLQIGANIFYALSFLLVGANVGAFIVFVSALRCVYLIFHNIYNFKFVYVGLCFFVGCYITLTIIFWQLWIDLIPLTTSIIYTFAYNMKNMQKMRGVFIVPCLMLITYSLCVGAYTNILLDSFEIASIIASIITFKKIDKSRKDNLVQAGPQENVQK